VFVERYGTGAQVFLGLHGWGGDRRTFAPLATHVPARASFYSADLPGCGQSPGPRAWTVGAVTDEIAETALSLGARGATLVGSCGGAVFALLAAEQLGCERIKRVVMIDPFAYLPRYFRVFTSEVIGRRAYDATFANPVGRWLTNQSLRGRRAGAADLTASFAETDHEVSRKYLALFDEVGGVERFRGLDLPVEIAHGERTFGAVRRSLAMWRAVLPRARVTVLGGAGHLPVVEATAQVAALLFGPAAGDGIGRGSAAGE
jgi:pimeloyl-ACP methyl ester carboxylesterase